MLSERLRPAKALDLYEVKPGKYFRLVAEVVVDGENMSDVLLKRCLVCVTTAKDGNAASVRPWHLRGCDPSLDLGYWGR